MDGRDQCIYLFGKLSEFLKKGNLFNYLSEIESDMEFIKEIEEAVAPVDFFKTKKFYNVYDFRFIRLALYVLVRDIQPDVIIETGVMHGLTSSFIIQALQKNNKGTLTSIDYPSYFNHGPSNQDGFKETLPPNKEPGWIVSDFKKKYWNLKIGKSIHELPKLLQAVNKVDIFFHDSEHTYETMWFEMNIAWDALCEGGIFIIDNIDNNTAFFDFLRKVNRSYIAFPSPDNNFSHAVRFGVAIK